MISIVLAALAAVLAGALGWFASAWFHQRKIDALRVHLKVVKETASEHSNQTRRQIAQLQAELEARRAAAALPPPRRAAEPVAANRPRVVEVTFDTPAKAAAVAAGGFAPTQVIPAEGFAVTEVMS
jgi:sRNA-binding protein